MARRGHSNAEYLFHDYDFHAVQERQRQRMIDAIQQAPAERLRSEDVPALVDAFVADFQIDVPELTEGAVSITVDEAQVDATGDFNRAFFGPGPHFVPGIRATYYVPYRGERDLFKCKPSTWTTVIPAAELANDELKFTFERADENVGATKLAFEQELGESSSISDGFGRTPQHSTIHCPRRRDSRSQQGRRASHRWNKAFNPWASQSGEHPSSRRRSDHPCVKAIAKSPSELKRTKSLCHLQGKTVLTSRRLHMV